MSAKFDAHHFILWRMLVSIRGSKYVSDTCVRCDSSYRYVSNNQCVGCKLKDSRLRNSTDRQKSSVRKHKQTVKFRDNQKRYDLSRKYDLTKEDFDRLIQNQNNTCPICMKPLLIPHVDHSHRTGLVRGLLCGSCNRALGLFHESIDVLRNAISYLEEK